MNIRIYRDHRISSGENMRYMSKIQGMRISSNGESQLKLIKNYTDIYYHGYFTDSGSSMCRVRLESQSLLPAELGSCVSKSSIDPATALKPKLYIF